MSTPDLAFFVGLERAVWESLVRGDAAADRAALADDFLGVYPTGFADADEHAAQLSGGPTVDSYRIAETRLIELGGDHVVLSYLATYRRPGAGIDEQMYVSSIWSRAGDRPDHWVNVFSQDTPVGDAVV